MKNTHFTISLMLTAVFCACAPAFAGVSVMSDADLDAVSAAGFDIDLDSAGLYRAVVVQENLAAVRAAGSANVRAANANHAYATGTAAIAAQANTAAVVSHGDMCGAAIENVNRAEASAGSCAVVSQANTAAIVSLWGSIKDSSITNSNSAVITSPSSRVCQANIAVIMARGSIATCRIGNSSQCSLNGVSGAVPQESYDFSGLKGVNSMRISFGNGASQKNTAIMISLTGTIDDCTLTAANSLTR